VTDVNSYAGSDLSVAFDVPLCKSHGRMSSPVSPGVPFRKRRWVPTRNHGVNGNARALSLDEQPFCNRRCSKDQNEIPGRSNGDLASAVAYAKQRDPTV